ncbi:hypothetical protein J4429_03270 [Candidatus Pacearchaeota archaeon]|nr:hypothetical protein [Candidatus Pacearchaeota archaeon]
MEIITKIQAEEILKRLSNIETRMNIIVEHVVDDDRVLSEDDLLAIEEAEKEYKEGRTMSHEQLKKELGIKCSK